MLTSVPTAINRSNRIVILRHPNAFEVVVLRKTVKRVEVGQDGNPSEMGGAPTLGGMGVLRSEDEAEFEYVELGEGKCLFTGPQYAGQDLNDADSVPIAERLREVVIECKAEIGTPEYWLAEPGDLVAIMIGIIVIAYEVSSVSSNVLIPPHNRKLVISPRDDLTYAGLD